MRTLCALLIGVAGSACYAYSPTTVASTDRITGTDNVVRRERVLLVQVKPSASSPILRLTLADLEDVRFRVRTTFNAVQVPSTGWNLFNGVLWLGAGAAALSHGRQMQTSTDSMFIGGGVLAMLGSAYFFTKAFDKKDVRPAPGKRLDGPERDASETRHSGGIAGQVILVRIDTSFHQYTTDASGTIDVNLIRDFGLSAFNEPRQMSAIATTPSLARPLDTPLDSRDWTQLCARTNGQGSIRSEASGRARALGEFMAGAFFFVESDNNANWLSIRYSGTVGWIPRALVTTCWANPAAVVR